MEVLVTFDDVDNLSASTQEDFDDF